MKFLNVKKKFWNGCNSRKRRFLRVLFFRTCSTRWRQVTVQKACAYDVRKAPVHDLLLNFHSETVTRDSEWQTPHSKGCQENCCGLVPSTDLWPQEMVTFFEMLALVESESSFGAYVCQRRPAGLHATSDLVITFWFFSTWRKPYLGKIEK